MILLLSAYFTGSYVIYRPNRRIVLPALNRAPPVTRPLVYKRFYGKSIQGYVAYPKVGVARESKYTPRWTRRRSASTCISRQTPNVTCRHCDNPAQRRERKLGLLKTDQVTHLLLCIYCVPIFNALSR